MKVTDFGTRKLKRDLFLSSMMNNPAISSKATALKAYQAPEVLTENKLTYASDVYSFALVFWEMAQDDQKPFMGVGGLDKVVVQAKERPPLESE